MDTAAFVRADSSNLPKVDTFMLLEFMKNSDKHNIAEIRGVKALMSSRESYVENAVGYVEVKRAGSLCDVRAKIVPEHKLSSKYYIVMVHLNDMDNTIIDTSCDGCAAAAGGCKHTLVLLYWLQKRSTEPSPTSVQCYWVKPNLKRAREEVVLCKDITKSKIPQMEPKDTNILERFRSEAKKHSCAKSLIVAYDLSNKTERITNYCIFDIMVDFVSKETDHSYENFKRFSDELVENKKDKINKETLSQVNSKLWHCMRQGRITGSKVHEIAHCKTPSGSLVEEILGGHKLAETKAMQRGKILEKRVVQILQQDINKTIVDSGFLIINGLFGASPDGIADDFVVEVKCPISEKTKKNYVNNGQICNKYMGQVLSKDITHADNKVCKLKRSLYGLKQAPRCWNQCITEYILKINFKQSESDPCLFVRTKEDKNKKMVLALYVDDGLIPSANKDETENSSKKCGNG